jgi:Major Facilitator Superfamily
MTSVTGQGWRSPAVFLMIAQGAMQLSWAVWWTLLNNYAVEVVHTTGGEFGLQQSIREIPGLLAFSVLLWLILMREQTLALAALALQGIGIAVTGYFPSLTGFYLTTLLMSFGFHYYEAMNQSLALQWFDRKDAAVWLGRIVAVGACAQLVAYGAVFLGFRSLSISFEAAFAIAGGLTFIGAIVLALAFPRYPQAVKQHTRMILRRRYWLYYALTFMYGARRQIFTVFAGFMMVTKFGFAVHEMALLYLANCVINLLFAPKFGAFIARFGERWSITVENVLLIAVFLGYAVVGHPWLAALLYVTDGALMTLDIAIRTYFQKIGDAADMAGTAGVGSSINHVAAVFIPVGLGLVWLAHPEWVFLIGAGFACTSLLLGRLVPAQPEPGHETVLAPPLMKPAE